MKSQQENSTLANLLAIHVRQHRAQKHIEATEFQRKVAKIKTFLVDAESGRIEGITPVILKNMRATLAKVERKNEFTCGGWIQASDQEQKARFFERMHGTMKQRGKLLKKLLNLKKERQKEALANEDDERGRLWSLICRKQVSKVARTISHNISARTSNARKVASLCAKEQQKAILKLQKSESRDFNMRSRRAMKEMLQFWKRNEREERDLRKRAEKEAAERRRQEEEEREGRRQNKKLQFLITQTELYSHFIARKTGTDVLATVVPSAKKLSPAVDFADLDDTVIREQAHFAAQQAVAAEREKLKKFDQESDVHRREAGGDGSTLGQDLDHLDFKAPSTLTDVQVEVRQPRMLQCQLKGYQIKGLTWLVNLYEQVWNERIF